MYYLKMWYFISFLIFYFTAAILNFSLTNDTFLYFIVGSQGFKTENNDILYYEKYKIHKLVEIYKLIL